MVIETEAVIGWIELYLWISLVDLNYNFGWDWLIELFHNKLSDNNLASKLNEKCEFFKPITYMMKTGNLSINA